MLENRSVLGDIVAGKPSERFESDEERFFSWYCDDLVSAGYLDRYEVKPNTFIISTSVFYPTLVVKKTKNIVKERCLVDGHSYTPDFLLFWNPSAFGVFYYDLDRTTEYLNCPFLAQTRIIEGKEQIVSTIEVKGGFDEHNMTRLFHANQKIVLAKFGVFVQKVTAHGAKSGGLFKNTFTPDRFLLTDKTMKPRKIHFTTRTLGEYVQCLKR